MTAPWHSPTCVSAPFCTCAQEEIERLRVEAQRWEQHYYRAGGERDVLRAKLAEVEKERDDLQRKNAAGSNQAGLMRDFIAVIEAQRDAALARVKVLEEIHREARWFSAHVYPPDVWLPVDLPAEYDVGTIDNPNTLDVGSHHSKRMNWWLARAALKEGI